MLRDLEDAEEAIDGRAGPLVGATKTNVAGLLDHVEEHIDQVLNSAIGPNLNPVDAGSIDSTYSPSCLAACAADCVDLAAEAVAEANGASPGDVVIGTYLKTIKNLLTFYRSEAGI